MSQVPGRARRLESVISLCLLGVLFLIGAGIYVKQSDYEMSRYGIGAIDIPKIETQGSKPESLFELNSIPPTGFEALSKTEVYNAENLYEKINGKAPLYTEGGFKELSTQRFANKKNQDLWMEIYLYDMGAVKNAFGVYSVQRRAESEIFPSIRFAYRTANALYFVHGRYYVEIVGSSESGELFKAITEVAQKIKANLAGDYSADISELAFFPQENLVPGSIKLYLANAFGFEGLTDTFTAKYKFGGEAVTAFLSERASPNDAKTIAEDYVDFLIENGAVAKSTTLKNLEGKIMDFYGTTEIVFTVGPFVAGVHEAESQEAAERLAEELINKLKSLKNE